MIRDFEEWSASITEVSPFEDFKSATIAIEAADYLKRFLSDPRRKEKLLPALGGFPYLLKTAVKEEIDVFEKHGITPYFVFSGMDVGKKDKPFRVAEESARTNAEAWALYDHHQAERAVQTFGVSQSVTAESLFPYFQSILHEAGVGYQVAPYSAWAQLAYLDKNAKDYFDAVAGSSEILLFDVEKIITKIDFESMEFSWVKRQTCLAALDNVSPDMFVDACLLIGSDLMPTLPQLEDGPQRKLSKLRNAINLMNSLGRTGLSVCQHYQEDPQVRSMNYVDMYRKSRLAVKHHVVMTKEGGVEPLDVDHAPGDMHEFMGQRLPAEIYYYLNNGVISPRVLNWRTSGEIIELPPLDNGESEEYRVLVKDQLTPLRTSTLSLLSQSLHHYYQHKDVTLRCYFDRPGRRTTISMKDLPNPKPITQSWNVKADMMGDKPTELKKSGTLSFAVQSLADEDFAKRTITTKDPNKPLKTKEEILNNSLWRFLHLRDYIDSTHRLTAWGKALNAMFAAIGDNPDLAEAAFLAAELLRLDLLNARNMFPIYSGGPLRGTATDKRNTLVVSRVACLLQLQHSTIGYTGPLSRHLLAYNSIISAVRGNLRNFVETSLVTLLLNGDAERNRTDFRDLGLSLPFLINNDCGLGIAMKSYLDELAGSDEPTSSDTKQNAKEKNSKEYFPYSTDLSGDLDKAFKLWDVIYAGVQVAGNLVKDKTLWDEVNEWLAPRR